MTDPGYYVHPAGAPSRWAVCDVGLKCTHSCVTCFYSYMDGSNDQFQGMRHARFHSTPWLLRLIDAIKKNGFVGTDYTGGEPSIHPGIVEITQHATDLGLATRMITLGQFFQRKEFDLLKRLLDAGLTDINFSTHAATEDLFHEITGESLAKQEAAKHYLDDLGFEYCSNCTISNRNYKTLPEIAKLFATHNIYVVNWLNFMPRYQWQNASHAAEVEAPFGEVYPYLKEATDILVEAGIAVNIRYAPLCTLKGLERHHAGIVGVRYDPHEWMTSQTHYEDDTADPQQVGARLPMRPGQAPGAELFRLSGKIAGHEIIAARGTPPGSISTVFPKKCDGCSAMSVCDGIDGNYLGKHGDGALSPYSGPSRGTLLDRERIKYSPAFHVKLKPWARIKGSNGINRDSI